ncbi:MAG: efflux RND transporter periplasmic adaptor subunit [Terracidiphilus sp.]
MENRTSIHKAGWLIVLCLSAAGCQKKAAAPAAGAGMQALPVQTYAVQLQPVPESSEYVATIKSRRSATIMPQVSGILTAINVTSGQQVDKGQVMMTIDPRQQQAMVDSQRATERQKKAVYDYNVTELERQKKLFEAGVTSREVYDQEQQAYQNSKADYESAVESRKTQEQLLDYYTIRAPFAGIVGDIPVHVGDYMSPSNSPPNVLTTVDEFKNLEAYVYIPTERANQIRSGLEVDVEDTNGKLLQKSSIDFISPQVDSTLQSILVKAPVTPTPDILRTMQMVKTKVIWKTSQMAVVPVLAVTRQGVQSFVYLAKQNNGHFVAVQVPVTLGDTVGNAYSITSGLNAGDKVIVSGTQFLVNGMPVMPLGG